MNNESVKASRNINVQYSTLLHPLYKKFAYNELAHAFRRGLHHDKERGRASLKPPSPSILEIFASPEAVTRLILSKTTHDFRAFGDTVLPSVGQIASVESSNIRPVIQTEFQPTGMVSRLRFGEASPSSQTGKQGKRVPPTSS